MIICKPRSHTLRSIVLFLLICYALLVWLFVRLAQGTQSGIVNLVGIMVLLLIALPLTMRLILRFKYIRAAKGKIEVQYPFLFRKITFKLSDLEEVREEQVKTFQDVYKELQLKFINGKLNFSKQEYTDYERFKAYIDKNKPRKKS
ncbi:MAG: hypothetical protein NW226_23335 [Microscillaceae bacterium]|nr:hypothetical protein [Microscillaceae bacterium]